MLKLVLNGLLVALLAGVAAPLVAEETMEEMTARCESYAKEDKIEASEMDEYMKECIEAVKEEAEAEAEQSKKD